MKKDKKFILTKTNDFVIVYKLQKGGWCNSNDCKTEYKDAEFECDPHTKKPVEIVTHSF